MTQNNEPNLMQLYLRHCAVGFLAAAVFVAMLLFYDIAQLGSLVMNSDIGWLAVLLLWFFHGTIFGAVQFAVSIMLDAQDDDNDDYRGGRMIPIRVPAQSRRR
ncbi:MULTISPECIES: hypothetical protein [unclassified Yoonia]|uniref:hypothetical protein n=1 Tax=unclassified Yoonia TaxID=2629118 RepID=UPI002AFF9CC4|nr:MULTISPECIES: hypothetical protein [unclassified Yoonia]